MKGAASKWCVLSLALFSPLNTRRPADSSPLIRHTHRDDEPASIQKYFSGTPAGPERTPLWKEYNLVSVGEF